MAFLLKNSNTVRTGGSPGVGQAYVNQYIHVNRPTALLPATSTDILFRVFGGRVLVHLFLGKVTVALDSTDPVLKVSSKALSAASVAVGTAVDVASTATLASLEVGGNVVVLGSGAAILKSNAGAIVSTLGRVEWIAPQGEIYITTGGTNLTGFMQWDIWYQPLDEGAYVLPNGTQTVI